MHPVDSVSENKYYAIEKMTCVNNIVEINT